jgi:hypothetical protein
MCIDKQKIIIYADLDVSISIDDPEAEALTDDANDNKNTCECITLFVYYI